MNPGFYVDLTSYQAGRTFMDVIWTSGASGVVPSPIGTTFYGITSVVHGATGVYTVTFNEQAFKLINWNLQCHQATYSASGACNVRVTAISLTARTVTILVTTAAGAAVEPASGDVMHWTFEWQRYGN